MSEPKMTLDEYVAFVTKLGSKYSMGDFSAKVGTMGLGLAGEAAEVSAIALKYNENAMFIGDEDKDKLIDELGDICWYVAFAAGNVVEVPFADLITYEFGGAHGKQKQSAQMLRRVSMSLSTDCGKAADIAKKLCYHGKPFTPEAKKHLVFQLKTIMDSLLVMAEHVCAASIDDLIEKNVAKLSERYKSLQFSTEEFMKKEEQAKAEERARKEQENWEREEAAKDEFMKKDMGF